MAKIFQVDTGGTLTTSLVSYWKLEDLTDFFSTNNLTGVGSPTFTAGKVGNALTLDGSTQYATCPVRLTYADFSLSFWFKTADVTVLQSIFQQRNTGDGNPIVAVFVSGSTLFFRLRDNSGGGLTTTTGKAVSNNTLYHVVVTYTKSSNAMNLYLNNGAADSATFGGGDFSNLNASNFGAEAFANTEKLHGQIDEFGLWTKVLSSTEITDLYNGGSGQTMILPQIPPILNINQAVNRSNVF